MMCAYTPTEGDVLRVTRQEDRYIVVDRVTETTCYCRRVDGAGGLLSAVKMPVLQFAAMVDRDGAKLHCVEKGGDVRDDYTSSDQSNCIRMGEFSGLRIRGRSGSE